MSSIRPPRAVVRPGRPVPAVPHWDLIVSVVRGLDGAGVVLWLLDARGRVTGALVGPADWPVADAVATSLVEAAVDADAAAIVAVRLRAGPAQPLPDDDAGFTGLVAACARAEIPVLARLLAGAGEVVHLGP
jgi:hypothetical protein